MTGRRSRSCPERRRGTAARRAAWLLALAVLAVGCATTGGETPARPQPQPASSDVLGRPSSVQAHGEDTFADIARRYDLGFLEMVSANPDVDPWVPGEGRRVTLPTAHLLPDVPREGIVINIGEQRLYWFRPDGLVESHPIGISRDGDSTPQGTTEVVAKKEHPTWTPPASARAEDPSLPPVVAAGPDNPLGDYALYLGWPSYLVHGTNEPDGVGRRVSRGCIRLYPEDIASLFASVPVGTPVRVVTQPVKLGWYGDLLLLEAHPSLDQATALDDARPLPVEDEPGLRQRIRRFAGDAAAEVDWERVERAVRERRGVPVRIARAPGAARAAHDAPVPAPSAPTRTARTAPAPAAATPPAPAEAAARADGPEGSPLLSGVSRTWDRAPDPLTGVVWSIGELLGFGADGAAGATR